MSGWAEGYVSELNYTYGYYPELNPTHAQSALSINSLVSPKRFETACELGFGFGLSANLHAATSSTEWFGTDFNPSQASFARELSNASGAKLHLYDEAFDEFCRRTDLPDFDYIGLHGIWSWVSDQNRALIVDFVRRKLKLGGVLYVSYNARPGWNNFTSLRYLMKEYAETQCPPRTGLIGKINRSIEFAENLLSVSPLFARVFPGAVDRISAMKRQNRNYLAHEYFNSDWQPMYFAQMAAWLGPTKAQFACSANILDGIDRINYTEDQLKMLSTIDDASFRETIKDFMRNTQFRKDYWVKGKRFESLSKAQIQFRSLRLIMLAPRTDVSMTFKSQLGDIAMADSIYAPILDLMSDYRIRSISEIEKEAAKVGVAAHQLVQAIQTLLGRNIFAVVQEDEIDEKVRRTSDLLNRHLISNAKDNADIAYLGSPVIGGGIAIGRFEQLFLSLFYQNVTDSVDLAKSVWKMLHGQGHKIVRNGKVIETDEDNINELIRQAGVFVEHKLPLLKALQIA